MSTRNIDASIEISTFNNKEVLNTVLLRLSKQTYPTDRFEVIISDDGSSDGLPEMVEEMSHELPYSLRMLRHEHMGPANAHNRGIEAAAADIVIMLAADILATPQLVEEQLRTHRQHPANNVVVSGGLVQSPELPDTVFQKSWNKLVNRLFSDEKSDLQHGNFFVSNLSFKKDFMLSHGMFKDWPPAAQEDIELGYRLQQHGMVLIRNNSALGYHHHPATLESVAMRSYTEGYNWYFFERNVPEKWVRYRAGHSLPGDGLATYMKCMIKQALRKILINKITITLIAVPLIQISEQLKFIAPIVPFLAAKVSVYYFHAGMRAYEAGAPYDLSGIRL